MKNLLINIGEKSKKAFSDQIITKKKDKVLKDYLFLIIKNKRKILRENFKDVKNAYKRNLKNNLIQRLILNDKKILEIINSIKKNNKIKRSNKCCFRKMETT